MGIIGWQAEGRKGAFEQPAWLHTKPWTLSDNLHPHAGPSHPHPPPYLYTSGGRRSSSGAMMGQGLDGKDVAGFTSTMRSTRLLSLGSWGGSGEGLGEGGV